MHAGECSEMPVFHRDDTLERKAVGYAEVVQSSGRSVPLSFGACLHMQSLSECTMSFLLGSAASFTVDWFLFRSRGQATGVGNGPDVRCMVEWQRCSRSTCPGCREGAGALLAALRPGIPLLGGGGEESPPHPPAGTAGSRSSAASARPSARAPVGTSAALSGGGGWAPLGQICCAVQVASRRPPFAQTHTDGHNAQTRHGICPPDLARSSGKRDHKCNRL
ncbi:uncharacterized protein LOC130154229 isoform X2 [Falco biarmicus]|uniref:uncharacterized protein LOC130154229 isoform X2 n=1 Tax=Falco biarmicus TaxID=345155 RepID=UPI0024BD41A4|nr:uncharacterized protein LOC130154229 isoform X2 [Falco biarmicus]XP_056206124.1 uncharacterized protein LOC130154229 isoform X2 [Falco biarmicus]